jgi:excisionase family DNA binding protein
MPRIAYRPKEAAQLLGVTERTVRAWIHKGDISSYKIGKLWFVPAEELIGSDTAHRAAMSKAA